uniref:Uncharacterized protein n=1 Tax=Glossina austeni TaxID=7395 RepID=A0A1A9UD60_GLOAU
MAGILIAWIICKLVLISFSLSKKNEERILWLTNELMRKQELEQLLLQEKYKNVSDKEQSLKQYFKEFKKGLENADVVLKLSMLVIPWVLAVVKPNKQMNDYITLFCNEVEFIEESAKALDKAVMHKPINYILEVLFE